MRSLTVWAILFIAQFHLINPALAKSDTQLGWHGDLPTVDQLLHSTISMYVGGSWGGNTSVLVAKPQSDGGYLVRMETIGPLKGVTQPASENERMTQHSIVTYRIDDKVIQRLHQQLSQIDRSTLTEEYEFLNVTDVGESFICFDLSDHRRWVIGGINASESNNANRIALSKAMEQCFVMDIDVSKPIPSHLLDFKHHVVVDNTPQAGELSLITPSRLTAQSQPDMPGILILMALREYGDRHDVSIDLVNDMLHGTSRFLAAMTVAHFLARPAMHDNPQGIRDMLKLAERWYAQNLDDVIHWVETPTSIALEYMAQKHDPETYELLIKFAQIQTPKAQRNMSRQTSVGLLRNYFAQHPTPIKNLWLESLEHDDPYIVKIAALCLVQMRIGKAGPLLAIQAQNPSREHWTQLDLHTCALALGIRASAAPLVDLLEKNCPNPSCRQYYIGQISSVLGIGVTEADLANHFADIPVQDDAALFNLAIQRLKRLPAESATPEMSAALNGMVIRWYDKPEARKELMRIKDAQNRHMALNILDIIIKNSLETMDAQAQGKFGRW